MADDPKSPKAERKPTETDVVQRYGDPSAVVKLARRKGFSTDKIVTTLTRGSTYAEVRVIAKRFAAALEISEAEFVRIARMR